jgi:hypothetical protein
MQQQLFKIYSSFAVDDSETSSVRCGLLPTSREVFSSFFLSRLDLVYFVLITKYHFQMASFYFDERSAVLQCLAALHRLCTSIILLAPFFIRLKMFVLKSLQRLIRSISTLGLKPPIHL